MPSGYGAKSSSYVCYTLHRYSCYREDIMRKEEADQLVRLLDYAEAHLPDDGATPKPSAYAEEVRPGDWVVVVWLRERRGMGRRERRPIPFELRAEPKWRTGRAG